MYAKIVDNGIQIAPRMLTVGNSHVWNASAEQYASQGWLPVVFSTPPYEAPADQRWESGWAAEDNTITQQWMLVPLAPDGEIDVGEALRITQDHLDAKNFYAFNPGFDTNGKGQKK